MDMDPFKSHLSAYESNADKTENVSLIFILDLIKVCGAVTRLMLYFISSIPLTIASAMNHRQWLSFLVSRVGRVVGLFLDLGHWLNTYFVVCLFFLLGPSWIKDYRLKPGVLNLSDN